MALCSCVPREPLSHMSFFSRLCHALSSLFGSAEQRACSSCPGFCTLHLCTILARDPGGPYEARRRRHSRVPNVLDQVEASIFVSLRADLRAPHGAANSMPRATPAQSWGKGARTFGSAPLWSTEPLLARDKGAPHGAANSMMVSPVRSRATPAQTWGKGVRTFGSAPRLASVKGDPSRALSSRCATRS